MADAVVALSPARGNRHLSLLVNGRDALAEQTPTHDDGSFALRGLDGGSYDVSVRDRTGQPLAWAGPKHADRPTEPIAMRLRTGEQRRGLTLRVEARNGVIRGVALGPDGAPAADTWVTATRAARSDLRGLPPGAPAGPPRAADPPAGDGEARDDGEARFEMHEVVMFSDDESGGGFAMAGSVPPVLTDSSGRFEITGLRQGSYDLMAEGLRGTARGFARGVATGSDTTVRLVALTRIDGTVTAGGDPVRTFRVRLTGGTERDKSVRDDAGRFTLHRVDPGDYTVEVTADEGVGEAAVTVVAGKPAKVTVALVGRQTVTGKVVDADGAPVADAAVLLGHGGPGNVAITMDGDAEIPRTAADSTFRVTAGPGKHLVLVLGGTPPRPLVKQPIEVTPGADLDLGTLTAR